MVEAGPIVGGKRAKSRAVATQNAFGALSRLVGHWCGMRTEDLEQAVISSTSTGKDRLETWAGA
jgi:hypothetical protein